MRTSHAVSSWGTVLVLAAMPLAAQEARPAPPRITQDIDETELVLLAGNTHPLARAEYDQGAAPPDLPMERMLLLLRRSPEQEASLQQLLEEQQDPGSVHYHQWLTPEQFGDQFGPALEDMGKITGWLKSQGFRVDGVANSRIVVEFSGTAAQVERGLHTQIHSFLVNGEQHWANAHDPQIPAALSPVVAGIVSLHNFPMKAMHRRAGAFRRAPGNDAWVPASPAPEFTYATNGGTAYVVGPYDFATIYNVLPLWNANAAIDGTGQSIAIVARSNIALQDVRNFRSLFGLPAHDPTITLNGPDPGTANVDNEFENVLDVEWAGAVAKGATINLVVSKSTTATDGSDLSAQYIVNNNLAPVLSSSYGSCELFMQLTSRSQFYNSLWQQAAAQGITVVVAAGDAGSATCDENENAALLGLQVDGAASTPYNVAVGGTDFSDVFSQNQGLYWSYNHPVTLESANSYVPEMTWNDSCASPELVSYFGPGFGSSSAEALCNNPQKQLPLLDVTGGGGGASTLYSKPAWQSGVSGIPSDGHRDVPDVSLFAGDGAWQHYYVVCQTDNGGPCNPSSPVGLVVTGGGGDSFGAPAFAGIMALVNQETGSRQGLANPTLYHLASAEYGNSNSPNTANLLACNASTPPPSGNACVFYDVTAGNNDVPCQKGSLNCYVSNPSDKYGLLSTSSNSLVPAYAAGPGYDLATGLGSINVANLVNKWPSPNTPLSISKAHTGNFAAGQTNATYTVTVSNGASAGPTSGMVTVSENAPVGLTLVSMAGSGWSCGGSACTRSDVLNPGSSYPAITVTVNVASNAPSQLTNQVTVSGGGSVSATASDVTRIATQVSTTTAVVASPSTIATTASTTLTATVTPNSGNGTPTGTVAFALGSMALGSATLTLTGGAAQATLTVKGTELAVGSDTITASYSGDANFASSSASATVTVTQSTPPSSGYTISTVAGNGTSGSSGDGGPASSAELGYPSGVAVDGAGNLFIADTFNARIRKVTPAGAISTVAGNGTRGFTGDGGPATSAELRLPGGVAVDSVGDLFIADETNNRIRKVTAAGAISTVAGNGTPGFSGDGGPATSAELFEPGGLAVDSGGNLFIADSMNNRIRKVTPAGTISTVAGNGVEGFGGDGQPAIVAELNQPNGVAIDSAGNLFIADLANNRIRKVTPAGTISTVAGNGTPGFSGDGGPATSAELFSPWDVAVDGAGNLFIADAFNDCIRKVTPGGTIGTVAGNGTPGFSGDGGLSTLAELRMPEAVAVDGAGNLFIADTSNNRIREATPSSPPPSPTITAVENGASFQSGFASATWVSIVGANLSQTTRLWQNSDFVNGLLPTSLSGISVTVNGVPAYVEYISPTQVNVLAPDDATVGQVQVQVTTAQGVSNSFMGQKQQFAPGFFTIAGSYVAALHADYSLVAKPGLIPGLTTTAAAPGETVLIWATGFGPTNPPLSCGQVVTTPAVLANSVTFTIGGVAAPVAYAGLVGSGLYQFNVTVPNVPNGDAVVVARIGGVQTQTWVLITIQSSLPASSPSIVTAVSGLSPIARGLAVDPGGNVYYAETNSIKKASQSGAVSVFAGTGTAGFSGDGGPATSAQLNSPQGVAVDQSGNVYIADYSNGRIRRVDVNGTITTFAGNGQYADSGDGGPATNASFREIQTVGVDPGGSVYVVTALTVRRIGQNGLISTVAGESSCLGGGFSGDGGPATSACLYTPDGVAFDGNGNMYIADYGNYRIREVGQNGTITTVAGNGSHGFSGDGGSALQAAIDLPTGIAVGPTGNLLFSSCSTERIRQVSSNGIIATVVGTGVAGFSGDSGPPNAAQLNCPANLALGSDGTLYVLDTGNLRIRRITLPASQ